MDPLTILPVEVCDEIFSNLNVEDIKEASKVSKHWYNIIGHSTTCMQKLQIRNYFYQFDNYESILNSNRQYQNLTITTANAKIMNNTKFLRILRAIVDKFSKSIVSLKVSCDLKPKSDLPNLKVLEFCYGHWKNVIVSNGLITKAKNLKELKIKCYDLDKKSIKYIQDAIAEKRSLKILDIRNINIIKGLNGLKLDEFRLNNHTILHDLPIVKEFFNTQISTLQVIESPLVREYITYFISNFQTLRTLIVSTEAYDYFEIFKEVPEYPSNHTVTKVTFKTYFGSNKHRTVHACSIISKLQNLQEANFIYLIPEFLPYLYNCPSLKFVKYKSLCYYFTQEQTNEIAQHERIKFIHSRNF